MNFLWTAPDGAVFPCEEWWPAAEPRAVLVCVHGLSGAATDFIPLAERAADEGLAVFGINLRGQGSDPIVSRRGAHFRLADFERDIVAFGEAMTARVPRRPVFWCGESMGSLILSHLLALGAIRPRGAILSVPVVELTRPTPRPIREFLRLLAQVVPRFRLHPGLFVSGKAEAVKITRDEEHARKNRASPHHLRAFTLGFLNAFGNLMASSDALARRIRTPLLVMTAGHDVFIRPAQVERWFDLVASSDKTYRLYPEAYHLLWNDWDKDQVLADISAWLGQRIGDPL